MIFQGDAEHAPPHVHAIKAGTAEVIYPEPIAVREVHDMTRADVRAAVSIVEQNWTLLMNAWRKFNG